MMPHLFTKRICVHKLGYCVIRIENSFNIRIHFTIIEIKYTSICYCLSFLNLIFLSDIIVFKL